MYILVLDFDGVITNLNIDWDMVRTEVSRAVGFKVDSILAFWENYFGNKLFGIVNEIVEKYELEAALRLTPYDDVKPALESFKGVAYLASMQSEKVTSLFLDRHDLRKYFREILGRIRFGSKTRQLEYVMSRERTCENVVLVDDSKRSIESCHKQGLSCILLNREAGDNLLNVIRNIP